MQASTAKRGVYPMHGYKLGLFRMPIKLDDPAEIKSILEGMKKTFDMDQYADRIYATLFIRFIQLKNLLPLNGYKTIEKRLITLQK